MRTCSQYYYAKVIMVTLYYTLVYSEPIRQFSNSRLLITDQSMATHQTVVNQYYETRSKWMTSRLGTYLFKLTINQDGSLNKDPPLRKKSFFKVLIWKHWLWLIDRHLQPYGNYSRVSPLYGCSVNNCLFSGKGEIAHADVVIVHLQHGSIPEVRFRNPNQLWIFWSDESPRHTFSLTNNPLPLHMLANMFNWSMTYRSDSDVPIPYGRTIPLPYPMANNPTDDILMDLVPHWNKKRTSVLAAHLVSACVPSRPYLLDDLRAHLKVDLIFASCPEKDRKSSPYIVRLDSDLVSEYFFYIVIENAMCRQYISEKVFYQAYLKGAIPVISGPPLADCERLLPPMSFLHIQQFESPKQLALEIDAIGKDKKRLLSYHAWRNNFETTNEHGFFNTKSYALCRLCEALNYNDRKRKSYGLDDIRLYLDPKISCPPTTWS